MNEQTDSLVVWHRLWLDTGNCRDFFNLMWMEWTASTCSPLPAILIFLHFVWESCCFYEKFKMSEGHQWASICLPVTHWSDWKTVGILCRVCLSLIKLPITQVSESVFLASSNPVEALVIRLKAVNCAAFLTSFLALKLYSRMLLVLIIISVEPIYT